MIVNKGVRYLFVRNGKRFLTPFSCAGLVIAGIVGAVEFGIVGGFGDGEGVGPNACTTLSAAEAVLEIGNNLGKSRVKSSLGDPEKYAK